MNPVKREERRRKKREQREIFNQYLISKTPDYLKALHEQALK